MVKIFSSHCFVAMVLGSKLIFSWSKNAMKLFVDSKIYSFITKLDDSFNIIIFLKITAQTLLQAVFQMPIGGFFSSKFF